MYAAIKNRIISVFYMTLLIALSLAQEHLSRKEVLLKLLNNSTYDANIVPDFDNEVPTNVTIQLIIQNMHSVSATDMEYSVDVLLRMQWLDERLNYTNFSNKSKLELDSKNIGNVWQPDVYFPNEKRGSVHSVTTSNKLMHIHRDGTVVYSIRLALTLWCTMSLQYYPFDNQRCPLFIQSYGYTIENIDLQWNSDQPFKLAPELRMPQFDVIPDANASDVLVFSTGTFSALKIEMELSRNVGFYFLQVFTPSVLLVFLSWLSFWVDPNAVPARVSLGVMCVLTMTTQNSGIRLSLPPVSYVKAIDVWMSVCLIFVFAALLEFAYVNVLMRRPSKASKDESKTDAPDDEVEKDHGDDFNAINIEEKTQPERVNKTLFKRLKGSLCSAVDDDRSRAIRVDCISRIVFPGTFVLFLLIFFGVCFSSRTFSRH